MILISTVIGILGLFTGLTSASDFVSPIGIAHGISEVATKAQFKDLVLVIAYFTGVLSMAVAAINLLPIPPLDGGKVLMLIIEWFRKKPVSEKVENGISIVFIFALMGLGIFVMIKDTLK